MSKNFTFDLAVISESSSSNSIIRLYKQNKILNSMDNKNDNPRRTEKQISKQLRFSESTIERYRDDIQMDSLYHRNSNKKRFSIQKPSTTTENHSKKENSKSITSKKTRNIIIKCGNPNNIHMDGRDFIQQAFFQNKIKD